MRIVDLARDLIGLSGLGEEDIEIVFTGLRPGEKLYEELYFDDEERLPTEHPKVFCARHRPTSLADVEATIAELSHVLDQPPEAVKAAMESTVARSKGISTRMESHSSST